MAYHTQSIDNDPFEYIARTAKELMRSQYCTYNFTTFKANNTNSCMHNKGKSGYMCMQKLLLFDNS